MKKTLLALALLTSGLVLGDDLTQTQVKDAQEQETVTWTWAFTSDTGSSNGYFTAPGVQFKLDSDRMTGTCADSTSVPETLTVTNITLSASDQYTRFAYVMDSEGTLLAVSTGSYKSSATNPWSWSFDNLVLKTDQTYRLVLIDATAKNNLPAIGETITDMTGKYSSARISVGSLTTGTGANLAVLSGNATDINTYGNNAPYLTVTGTHTHTVPEPATATLSLLALVGLAARRRRK